MAPTAEVQRSLCPPSCLISCGRELSPPESPILAVTVGRNLGTHPRMSGGRSCRKSRGSIFTPIWKRARSQHEPQQIWMCSPPGKWKFLPEFQGRARLQDAPRAEHKGETTFLAGNTSRIFPAFCKFVSRGFPCYCQSAEHPKNGAIFVSLSGSLPICSGSLSPQQALNKNYPISSPANRFSMTNSVSTHSHTVLSIVPAQKRCRADVSLAQCQEQSSCGAGNGREGRESWNFSPNVAAAASPAAYGSVPGGAALMM